MVWFHLMLIALLILGIITGIEDIRFSKIRNLWISIGLGISIILNLYLVLIKSVGLTYISILYGNTVFALLLGGFLWYFGFWTAGDAKLLTAFISLIPLTQYQRISVPLPVVDVLINSMIPLFICLLMYVLFKTNAKQKTIILRTALRPDKILRWIIVVFSLSWVSSIAFKAIGLSNNIIYSIIAIIAFHQLLKYLVDSLNRNQKIQKIKLTTIKVMLLIILLRAIFQLSEFFSLEFWKHFLLLTLLYGIVRMVIYELGEAFVTEVLINDLKPGMMPAELIVNQDGYKRIKIPKYGDSQREIKIKNLVYDPSTAGLTSKDIRAIKRLQFRGKIHFNRLRMQQTIPFAPFLFIGSLITFLSGSTVIILGAQFLSTYF